MRYSFDTSALIGAWRRNYPPDIFPKWWELFEESINNGLVRATEEVKEELSKQDDELYSWARNHHQLFLPIDELIQLEVKDILESYPRLVENKKNRTIADPFVIALAKINNAIVVTCENLANRPDRPNIPDVCRGLNIDYVDLLGFMRSMNWRF